MKLLITGAGGFIGSHLVETAIAAGYDVRAFVHYNSKSSWGWLDALNLKNQIQIIPGDIRDFDSVRNAVNGCESILHLAALIGIPYSYISPMAYIKTNIEGTYNILEAAREFKVNNIVITSTSETYGTAQYVPIDEKHPSVGQSPYAASKIAADQLATSYHKSFGCPVKIIRPFNTYGPRQSARAVIPSIILQILSGQRKIKLGNVSPTRDLTFVKDTCRAFLAILSRESCIGEVVNVGMNHEISIRDLVHLIAGKLEASIDVITDHERERPANSEVDRLCCDNKKILKLTEWRPQYNLESGLDETIDWLKNNLHLYKSELYHY
jgi:NAD dependent epimerase/dehydratase